MSNNSGIFVLAAVLLWNWSTYRGAVDLVTNAAGERQDIRKYSIWRKARMVMLATFKIAESRWPMRWPLGKDRRQQRYLPSENRILILRTWKRKWSLSIWICLSRVPTEFFTKKDKRSLAGIWTGWSLTKSIPVKILVLLFKPVHNTGWKVKWNEGEKKQMFTIFRHILAAFRLVRHLFFGELYVLNFG